jgi:hypothetical protein
MLLQIVLVELLVIVSLALLSWAVSRFYFWILERVANCAEREPRPPTRKRNDSVGV